jgi:hypothetical protein
MEAKDLLGISKRRCESGMVNGNEDPCICVGIGEPTNEASTWPSCF